jgi:hypothetical protein
MDVALKRNHVIYKIRLFQLNIGGVLFIYEEIAFYKVKTPRFGCALARNEIVLNKTPYYL